jgi:hypothetical protein
MIVVIVTVIEQVDVMYVMYVKVPYVLLYEVSLEIRIS